MKPIDLFDARTSAVDPAHPAAVQLTRAFASHANDRPDSLEARLAGIEGLVERAAAWTVIALGDPTLPEATGVHRVAVLATAADRSREQLVERWRSVSDAIERDLDSMTAIAQTQTGPADGPVSRYVLDTIELLAGYPGYERGRDAFGRLFAAMLDGLIQEYRLRTAAREVEVGPRLDAPDRGGWVDLVIEAACIALGDASRATHLPESDLVARLASSLVAVARDLGAEMHGGDTEAAKERLCQRFAVAPHLVPLDPQAIHRALVATTELEARDLLDALRYLPEDQPRRDVVLRTVRAVLDLDDVAGVIAPAMDHPTPSRDGLMAQMSAVARADGRITSDERALLRGMDAQVFAFQQLMARVDEDRHVDEQEFEQLRSTRQHILDELFRIALADREVTDEERDLLLRAMELVPSLR